MSCELCKKPPCEQHDIRADLCEDCFKKASRKINHLFRLGRLLESGDITPATVTANFGSSVKKVEAQNPKAWAECRAWRGEDNLYLWGSIGVGKSHAAGCLLHRHTGTMDVHEVIASNIVQIGAAWNTKDKKPFIKAQRAPLLLLDDLDKANLTKWSAEALRVLLGYRETHGLRTIVTANMHIAPLGNLLASSVPQNKSCVFAGLDRLGILQEVEFKGDSVRRWVKPRAVPEILRSSGHRSFARGNCDKTRREIEQYVLTGLGLERDEE